MNRKKQKNVFISLLLGDDYLMNHNWLFEIAGGFFLYIFENGVLNIYFSAEMLLLVL